MDNFSLSNIVDDIISLEKNSDFVQNIEVFLIRKVKQLENELYKQETSDETKQILFSSLKHELNQTRFKNRDVIPYDAVISKKNTHELVEVKVFPNIVETLGKFSDEEQYLTSTKGLNESKFHFYMVSLSVGQHSYKIFGNFSNVLELQKKYLIGRFVSRRNFTDSTLEFGNDNNIFGFNKKIELLVVDDQFILINQAESKFESLFQMNQLFSSQATNILNENEKIKQVFDDETRQKLIEKVSTGKRMASRLIKITSDKERFNKTVDNISKIQAIIANKDHKFYNKVKDVVFKEGKLSVPEGQEVQLLDAISDAFYYAIISETDNIDVARM